MLREMAEAVEGFTTQRGLVVALEDRAIDLKRLGERLVAGRLSFGSPERLARYLGVEPGSVTPFAVINDTDHKVTLVLDEGLKAALGQMDKVLV